MLWYSTKKFVVPSRWPVVTIPADLQVFWAKIPAICRYSDHSGTTNVFVLYHNKLCGPAGRSTNFFVVPLVVVFRADLAFLGVPPTVGKEMPKIYP